MREREREREFFEVSLMCESGKARKACWNLEHMKKGEREVGLFLVLSPN